MHFCIKIRLFAFWSQRSLLEARIFHDSEKSSVGIGRIFRIGTEKVSEFDENSSESIETEVFSVSTGTC